MYCTIITGCFVVLIGFIVYLWDKSRRDEARRLYRWLDDIQDRIMSGDVEKYAFTHRIKFDVLENKRIQEKIKEEEKAEPPLFVQGMNR